MTSREPSNNDTETTVTVLDVTVNPVVAAGENHTCGVWHDGTLRCWGDDTYDQVSSAPPVG